MAATTIRAGAAKDTIVATTVPGIVLADNICSLIEAIINANSDDQSGSPDCSAGDPDIIAEDHSVLPAKKTISLTAPFNHL